MKPINRYKKSNVTTIHIIKYITDLNFLRFDTKILENLIDAITGFMYINYIKIFNNEINIIKSKNVMYLNTSKQLLKLDSEKSDLYISEKSRFDVMQKICVKSIYTKSKFDYLWRIENEVFYRCGFVAIDLSLFVNVTEIGNEFLTSNQLTSINLSPLKSLTKIGNNFLSYNRLTVIDLAPLHKVKTIGDNFLLNNPLKFLDLFPLTSLIKIGNPF